MSGHSILENNYGASSIFTWVQADTASAACPAHPGSLDMISITFAAVIYDADEPHVRPLRLHLTVGNLQRFQCHSRPF